MARPDVVTYLHENLNKFPVEQLKKQLLDEGISEAEFNAALNATQTRRKQNRARVLLGRMLLIGGLSLVGIALAVHFLQDAPKTTDAEPGKPSPQATTAAGMESAFLGKSGYVLKLPKDYAAIAHTRDNDPDDEIVHFCRAGTDPSNFLNEGLYGQLGIVRLEVMKSRYAGQINGLEALSREIAARAQSRGEKYSLKNIQVSALRGIQVNYEAPDARVETYVIGQNVLYFFMAGQDDEIYRSILQSLRDAQSET